MTNQKLATCYHTVFDTTRVQNFNPNVSYRILIETGTGHYKTAPARFTQESGWEYFHSDYDKWLPIPDEIEIFQSGNYEPYEELLDRFISQNPDYLQYRTNFVCDFSSLEDIIQYQPLWWEDRYQNMSNSEIIHEWNERNYTRVAEFEGRYLLFGNCDL